MNRTRISSATRATAFVFVATVEEVKKSTESPAIGGAFIRDRAGEHYWIRAEF